MVDATNAGWEFRLLCEPEHCAIEGNASAIDAETDAGIVAGIRSQLDAGNEWAWCFVTVEARHPLLGGIVGRDSLGCCSYRSEADFREPGGYFDDMKSEALEDALRVAFELVETAEGIREALHVLDGAR